MPRLSVMGTAPLPSDALEKTARNRRSLSYQSACLVQLIDALLKGETRAVKVEPALFPNLRLPGDNPDDAARYLLRGLRNELRNFDGCLKAMAVDPTAPRSRLVPLRELGLAVTQVFASAPESGAGRAVLSMIANLMDQSGIMAWTEFLQRYGGRHAGEWTAVDITAHTGPGPGAPARPAPPRAKAPARAPSPAAKVKEGSKPKGEAEAKPKAKAKAKSEGKSKTKHKSLSSKGKSKRKVKGKAGDKAKGKRKDKKAADA